MERTTKDPVQRNRPNAKARDRFQKYKDLVPVAGAQDILTVENKDPDFFYYWVVDTQEGGSQIFKHKRAGYKMVDADAEPLVVGSDSVYKTEKDGSIYRVPARSGGFHFLMKLPMELYEMYQEEREVRLQQTEASVFSPNEEQGQYGRMSAPKRAPKVKVFGKI